MEVISRNGRVRNVADTSSASTCASGWRAGPVDALAVQAGIAPHLRCLRGFPSTGMLPFRHYAKVASLTRGAPIGLWTMRSR